MAMPDILSPDRLKEFESDPLNSCSPVPKACGRIACASDDLDLPTSRRKFLASSASSLMNQLMFTRQDGISLITDIVDGHGTIICVCVSNEICILI